MLRSESCAIGSLLGLKHGAAAVYWMDKARLEASIATILAPALREEGFRGSGRTFRRVSFGFLEVLDVQRSRWGGAFAINLGIQPMAVPIFRGGPVDARKTKEVECEFRTRLAEDGVDQWFTHDGTQASMDLAVWRAVDIYFRRGRPFFAEMAAPSSPLLNLTPMEFESASNPLPRFSTTKARAAFVLARLRYGTGDLQQARAFAKIAHLEGGPHAVVLVAEVASFMVSAGFGDDVPAWKSNSATS